MHTNQVARIAALVGEPARTGMLLALMDGRALTARELARAGHVSPQTASRHLAQLVDGGLLVVERQGRHRYHRLASPQVARLLEGMMELAAVQPAPRPVATGPRDEALRTARTCYDHLAGRLGVAIADHLVAAGAVIFDGDAGQVTDRVAACLAPLGLDWGGTAPTRQPACRPCLDWSQRRPRVAGRLGRLLCQHCLAQGWLRREAGSRALAPTPAGVMVLREWLGERCPL